MDIPSDALAVGLLYVNLMKYFRKAYFHGEFPGDFFWEVCWNILETCPQSNQLSIFKDPKMKVFPTSHEVCASKVK